MMSGASRSMSAASFAPPILVMDPRWDRHGDVAPFDLACELLVVLDLVVQGLERLDEQVALLVREGRRPCLEPSGLPGLRLPTSGEEPGDNLGQHRTTCADSAADDWDPLLGNIHKRHARSGCGCRTPATARHSAQSRQQGSASLVRGWLGRVGDRELRRGSHVRGLARTSPRVRSRRAWGRRRGTTTGSRCGTCSPRPRSTTTPCDRDDHLHHEDGQRHEAGPNSQCWLCGHKSWCGQAVRRATWSAWSCALPAPTMSTTC